MTRRKACGRAKEEERPTPITLRSLYLSAVDGSRSLLTHLVLCADQWFVSLSCGF